MIDNEFKDIPGYDGKYQINKKGVLRSKKSYGYKILLPYGKYNTYGLYKDKKNLTIRMEYLVDYVFNGKKLNIIKRDRLPVIEIDNCIMDIINTVCKKSYINPNLIQTLCNEDGIRVARQTIHHIASTYTDLEWGNIAHQVGGKHRTSIYNSRLAIKNLIDTDKKFKIKYSEIIKELYGVDMFQKTYTKDDIIKLVEKRLGTELSEQIKKIFYE